MGGGEYFQSAASEFCLSFLLKPKLDKLYTYVSGRCASDLLLSHERAYLPQLASSAGQVLMEEYGT